MNLRSKFKIHEPPYLHFSELVDWRNSAVHHKPQPDNVEKYKRSSFKGEVSKIYADFNANNAKRAVNIVKEMIPFLSIDDRIPKPKWLDLAPDYR